MASTAGKPSLTTSKYTNTCFLRHTLVMDDCHITYRHRYRFIFGMEMRNISAACLKIPGGVGWMERPKYLIYASAELSPVSHAGTKTAFSASPSSRSRCQAHHGSVKSLTRPDLHISTTRSSSFVMAATTDAHEVAAHDDDDDDHSQVPDTDAVVGSDVTDQLTPHDLWVWNSQTHWKHWHGIWTLYQPLVSPNIVKENRSIRSLWPVDKDRVHLYHRNQWYGINGEPSDAGWEYGPWAMYEKKHSLPDGILHPNSLDHRILQFPNGDLGWVQLALKPGDPKSVVFNELHFMASPEARMPVVMGYDSGGRLGVALMLEETRETDEPAEATWKGTRWRHHSDAIEATREEPKGIYVGLEMEITSTLKRTTRQAKWAGFRGAIPNDHPSSYTLVHLPNHVTVCSPTTALVGKPHSYLVSWIVNDTQIRVLSVRYSVDGRLLYVKSGTYDKVI